MEKKELSRVRRRLRVGEKKRRGEGGKGGVAKRKERNVRILLSCIYRGDSVQFFPLILII